MMQTSAPVNYQSLVQNAIRNNKKALTQTSAIAVAPPAPATPASAAKPAAAPATASAASSAA